MSKQTPLDQAIEASKAVEDIRVELHKALIKRAESFVKAAESGCTQPQIADACDVHEKTVQADIRSMRRTS